jgi:ketosteroid isomerase-like protein
MAGEEAVRAANQAFYDAFEQRDLDAMSDVWERSERATCTHPGWPTLRGWGKVASSFFALFSGSQHMQFLLTNEHVYVDGVVAWVSVDENLLGDQGGNTVAALNVFTYDEGLARWRLVCHHGSVVTAGIEVD